jgi:Xaa-Pro aminopeptidase
MTFTNKHDRLQRVAAAMKNAAIDALIISDPQSIWYLTGIWNEPYERLYVLYLEQTGTGFLMANRLFTVTESAFPVIWYQDSDNAADLLSRHIRKQGTIGIDKIWPARFLLPLIRSNPQIRYTDGSFCIDGERAKKDTEEQTLMREASAINDRCITEAFASIDGTQSEKEIARRIDTLFREHGADGPSFETIVSFGAHAADPHHSPDDTKPREGECILIDMGCRKNHYCSDMTRTNFFRYAPEEYQAVHELVRIANECAEKIIRPGVRFCDIDVAARTIISDAGYGEYFTHRLGHFCGQSDHEQGDVSAANTSTAEEGMIFSIEPGIYLPGKTGVRIEDLVLVTKDGYEPLNHVDKKWSCIG